jgi:hypothetical protein
VIDDLYHGWTPWSTWRPIQVQRNSRNAQTVMSRPNAELIEGCFPGVPIQKELGPNETLLSIEKARRVLGYEPLHSWRKH